MVRVAADEVERTVAAGPGGGPRAATARTGDVLHLDVDGRTVAFRLAPAPDVDRAASRAVSAAHAGGAVELAAPMPGSVLEVHVRAGATVAAGDAVITLEAMKMEHVVAAPIAGRVTDIRVSKADQIVRGQVLGTIEP
jgi:acetyl-CoA/propionyl-CoA carboxylase biotin carboxyl carrier protein